MWEPRVCLPEPGKQASSSSNDTPFPRADSLDSPSVTTAAFWVWELSLDRHQHPRQKHNTQPGKVNDGTRGIYLWGCSPSKTNYWPFPCERAVSVNLLEAGVKRRYDASLWYSWVCWEFQGKGFSISGLLQAGRVCGASETSSKEQGIEVALCITGALRNCRWKLGSAWERRKDWSRQ